LAERGATKSRAAVITRAYSEFWLGTSLDRKKLTQALPSLPETADELEAVAAKLGDSAYRRRTPYKKLYDEMNFQRAVLCYLWATQNVGMGGITQDDYDKKARELKEQQAEIATRIEQHQQGNAEYRTTLESLISLKPSKRGNSLPSSFRTCSSEEKSITFALRSDGRSAILYKLARLPEYSSNRAL
jgi:hypothetical protein